MTDLDIIKTTATAKAGAEVVGVQSKSIKKNYICEDPLADATIEVARLSAQTKLTGFRIASNGTGAILAVSTKDGHVYKDLSVALTTTLTRNEVNLDYVTLNSTLRELLQLEDPDCDEDEVYLVIRGITLAQAEVLYTEVEYEPNV